MCHSGIVPGTALLGFGVGVLCALLIKSVFILIVFMIAAFGAGVYLLQK